MKACPHCSLPLPASFADAWQEHEDQTIRDIYPVGGPAKVIELLPSRSLAAIKVRASNLGVHLVPPWTTGEINLLRIHYPTGGAAAAQRFMPHRSLKAIKSRARLKGIAGPCARGEL